MNLFLRIFQHLLPRARAWLIVIEKRLRQFFDGLSGTGSDVKDFADDVYDDIFPQTTRELDAWEEQFGLPNNITLEQDRRDRLDGAWKAQGGQSPRYIQDTLQNAGFDVYIHEWWVQPEQPTPPQVPRNAYELLTGGAAQEQMQDGAEVAQDGDEVAQDGGSIGFQTGYALRNNFDPQVVPNDPTVWPYFLYFAGPNFIDGMPFPTIDFANIPASRRTEFETLCLKICPTQQWLGFFVNYV